MFTLLSYIGVAVAAFVGGILVGRRNKKKVEAAVGYAKDKYKDVTN